MVATLLLEASARLPAEQEERFGFTAERNLSVAMHHHARTGIKLGGPGTGDYLLGSAGTSSPAHSLIWLFPDRTTCSFKESRI